MYHHGINNNKMIPASVKSKRFWKRKNRSRSPSRSVGRSEVSECFTSSEDEISSISIDDISSDLIESELSENLVGEIDRDFELEIGENENIWPQCPDMILNIIEKTNNKTYTGLKRFLQRFQMCFSQNPSCKGMGSTS